MLTLWTGMAAGNDDPGRITVVGTLTDEGIECQALRSEAGELYTLAGALGDVQVGDRVQVVGTVAEMSFCMQGTTVAVERVISEIPGGRQR